MFLAYDKPCAKSSLPLLYWHTSEGLKAEIQSTLCRTNQAPFLQRLCKASCCQWIPSNAVNNSLENEKQRVQNIILSHISQAYILIYFTPHLYYGNQLPTTTKKQPMGPINHCNQVASIRQLWASWIFPKRNAQSPIWAITPGVLPQKTRQPPTKHHGEIEDTSKSTNVETILATGNCIYLLWLHMCIIFFKYIIVTSCGKWCIDDLKTSLELAAELRLYRICVCTSDSAAWPSKSHRHRHHWEF